MDDTASEPRFDDHGRPEPPLQASELATLVGFLEFQRATLAWKTAGVDDAGMRGTTAATSMTLAGLLKHLALVEDVWFSRMLHGNDRGAPWDAVDWDADPDWEWRTANLDDPDQVRALWLAAVVRSRALLDDALAAGGLDQPCRRSWPDEPAPNLRWVLVHMVEEYARHNGHADLLREAVDGATGE